jgi:tetratricopeptide (TPR) repeat protein
LLRGVDPPQAMKRLLLFDWMGRHRIATGASAMVAVAALVLIACTIRGGDFQAPFASAAAFHQSAETFLEQGLTAGALRHCRRAIAVLDELAARSNDPQIRFEQAAALETRALIESACDQPDQADAFFRRATTVWARLLADNQAVASVRWRLARCLSRHAPLLIAAGRWEEAENALERGDIVCGTRVSTGSPDRSVDHERVLIKNQLGLFFLHTGRPALALEHFESALALQNGLIQASAASVPDQELLITLLNNQAKAYSAAKQPEAALGKIGEARKLAERLNSEYPSVGRYRDLVATLVESEAGELERISHRAVQARERYERAVAIRESLVAGSPSEPGYLEKLAETCGRLAESYLAENSLAKAEKFERKELSYQTRLQQEHQGAAAYRFGRGQAMHNLAELLGQRGRAAEALAIAREAAPLLESVYRENVLDEDHRRAASYAYWMLCTLQLERKDHRAAAQTVAVYQSIEPGGFEEAHESAGFLCRCIVLCRDDHDVPLADKEGLEASYAARAMGALQTAVRYGFRDLNELKSSHIYDPLRHRPDFVRVVQEVTAIDEALKEG